MPVEFPTTTIPLLFLVGYLVGGVISTAFTAYIVRYRWEQPAARAFGVVSIALAIWVLAYVGRMLSPSLASKLLWTQLAWVGITLTPVAVLAFVLIFTGRANFVTRKSIGALLVVPIITQVVLSTNQHHHLFYEAVWLYTGDTIPFIASRGGAWFYGVHIPYAWGLYFIGTVLLIQFAFTTRHIYRSQVLALVFGAIFPWFVNGTFLAGLRLHPELDPTPIGIAIGMGAIAIAVFRVDFLGIVPVAREKVIDEVGEFIFILDDTGRIIDVNDSGNQFLAAYNNTSWSVGDRACAVFPPELVAKDLLEDGERSDEEVRLSVGGTETWYIHRRHRLGHPLYSGTLVTLTDISAQKRQLELLERKNAQLEQVAGVMSHDLRNPLSVATGYLRRMDEKLDTSTMPPEERTELRATLKPAQRAHERMAAIIEDVLVLARSGDLSLDAMPVDLEDGARSAWEYVQTVELELSIEKSSTVEADKGWLLRVFENLFRNTVDHGIDATTIWVGVIENGFYVEDDGIGIPEHQRQTIFDRGVTGDTGGTGIGLSIVRNVVAAHGWEIDVLERDGGGTRFEITGVEFLDDKRRE